MYTCVIWIDKLQEIQEEMENANDDGILDDCVDLISKTQQTLDALQQ